MITSQHLIALGDSHLEALKFAAELDILDVKSTHFVIVPGATVIGLRNPNSFTDAINIFMSVLEVMPQDSYVVIHLGEVDCGFVMWWRAVKYGESIDIQFRDSINSYHEFLLTIIKMGFKHICIAGASLPTIDDATDMSDVANKRKEINVSIRDRTKLTLKYNQALRDLSTELGIKYFDITDAILNRTNYVVHDFFKNNDPCDHHLDKLKTVGIWANKINAFTNE